MFLLVLGFFMIHFGLTKCFFLNGGTRAMCLNFFLQFYIENQYPNSEEAAAKLIGSTLAFGPKSLGF